MTLSTCLRISAAKPTLPANHTPPVSGFIRVLYAGVILNPISNCRLLRDSSGRRNLVGGMSAESGNGEEVRKTGLEGTGLPLPGGSHGSVRCAGSDPQLRQMLDSLRSSKSSAVINYGASWCGVCSQILPPFCRFSNEFKNLTFIYAHVDECPETTQNIRYTPTFHFYRDGERVDEMFGAGEERLRDRLWLHS
ncbi:Thioredoxin-1 [Hordeum vulgare]|nr:thioredoxin-like 3-3 isoform X1 [Hordeum vulgare subsp. vulgare]KAE8775294.1 Thioredoxin-1 [Hordeum vulgare]